jgi:hypothetical protein
LIAWNQDDAGVQGTFRASEPYADGDVQGQQLPAEAIHTLAASERQAAAAAAAALPTTSATTGVGFHGLTYCAYEVAPAPQRWSFTKMQHGDVGDGTGGSDDVGGRGGGVGGGAGNLVAVQQGRTCLTTGDGNTVVLSPCKNTSLHSPSQAKHSTSYADLKLCSWNDKRA